MNDKEYNVINKKIDDIKAGNKNDINLEIEVPDSLKNTISLGMSRCEEYQNKNYKEIFFKKS